MLIEVLRAPVRGSQLAPSLYASVHLLAYKESCAVERGLVARALAANTNADEVPVATLLRLRDASVRQALLDDLDDLVRADAARARRATRGRAGIVAAAALGGLAAYVVLPLAL